MFDFRYHALSLVAVFLALAIGIVLGATLGDSVLSEANKDVRSSLRGDLLDARAAADKAQGEVSQRDHFIDAAFARLADSRLQGAHVAIVSSGSLPQGIENEVRGAVKSAGGSVDSISELDAQPNLQQIAQKLGGKFSTLPTAPDGIRTLGRRIGHAIATGGRLAKKLQSAFPDSFNGDFARADAIVYYRTNDSRDATAKTFESALIEGLRSSGVPVVGAEETGTNPSQVPFYTDAALSSVDDVDQPAGRIALVLTLAGSEGSFGFKQTADAPLPPPTGAPPTGSGG